MTSDKLRQFAEVYAKAWCSHDPEAIVAFYAKDALISVNDGPSTPIAQVAQSFMRDFPDLVVTFDKLEPRGDRIAFHWTLSGTYAQNGNRVRISGYEFWKIDNDRLIVESEGHFNAEEYARQLREGAK